MKDINNLANEGGVNGTGKGIVNVNSEEYKALQAAILDHAKQQTKEERIKYHLLGLKYQMESYAKAESTKPIKTVGAFLKEHLQIINIKNKTFAQYLGIEPSNLSAMLKGKRKISVPFAYKLGLLFNVNPNLWLNIQNKNDFLEMKKKAVSNTKVYNLKELLKEAM